MAPNHNASNGRNEVIMTTIKSDDNFYVIKRFLDNPTNSTYYDAVVTFLNSFSSCDIMLIADDGSVVYDSRKGNENTYANCQANTINENHHSRPEVLTSLLSVSGAGTSDRYSRTKQMRTVNLASRLGSSSQMCLGTLRVSQGYEI